MDQWVQSFPPITRTYAACALLTTAACALDVLSPFSLYFSWPMVVHKGQVWRIVTNFFFFGAKFSFDFLFHMFFLVQYCRQLEEGSFRNRPADFFWLLLFGAISLLLIAPLANLHFLGSSLTFMMVYIGARRNPFVRMQFLGLFTFTAPYLPWVLLSFSFLLGNDLLVDLLGIGVGHVYYFLEDVYPRMLPSRRRLLKIPRVVEWLFASHATPAPEELIVVDFEREREIARQIEAQQQAQQGQQAAQQPGHQAPAAAAAAGEPPQDEGVILAE